MQVGFDARPNDLGPQMTERKPSVETLYVATTMALIAIQALSSNLAAYLSGVERVDGTPSEDGIECVKRQLDLMMHSHLDTAVTDLPPGSYDAEQAREIAFDTIREHNAFVLERIL